jgi:hypothetical protein
MVTIVAYRGAVVGDWVAWTVMMRQSKRWGLRLAIWFGAFFAMCLATIATQDWWLFGVDAMIGVLTIRAVYVWDEHKGKRRHKHGAYSGSLTFGDGRRVEHGSSL